MFPMDKGGAAAAAPTAAPAAGGFFQQIRNDFKPLTDKIQAPYSAMSENEKKRYQQFAGMAMKEQPAPQFSPVQFGGAGGGGDLASLVAQILKGTGQ